MLKCVDAGAQNVAFVARRSPLLRMAALGDAVTTVGLYRQAERPRLATSGGQVCSHKSTATDWPRDLAECCVFGARASNFRSGVSGGVSQATGVHMSVILDVGARLALATWRFAKSRI